MIIVKEADAVKKRIILAVLLLVALVFSGCALRTVEEMYSLPKRSEKYNQLQTAIDDAMTDLEYAAPTSGDNRQILQNADLDGDGTDEYIIFAKGETDKPLRMLIFRQQADGGCTLVEDVAFRGSSFVQVEYVPVDDSPGCEIVLGRQLSDQLMGTVNIYSFSDGSRQQLLSSNYTKFLTCDLDSNGKRELLILRPGEADMGTGVAVLYSFKDGSVERSVEVSMSARAEDIKRITASHLYGGDPAIYISSAGRGDAVVTDVIALREERLVNISESLGEVASVDALRNYAVYASDLDNDGVLELPKMMPIKPIVQGGSGEDNYLLRWYAMDLNGNEMDKLCTFHNFSSGWYLRLGSSWASYLTVDQRGDEYTFYMWDEQYEDLTVLFTVSEFSGNDREYQASQNNRFVLARDEEVTYAARLETGSGLFGFTEDYLISNFRLFQQN